MAHRTVGVGQTIRLSGTATTSTAFKVQSNVLRIVASGANAYVAIGTDPVATATDYLVTSNQPDTLAMLKQSQRVVGKSRSAGVGGDFEEKITVEANTAGVSTAFTPTGNVTLFMSNKVSVISPNSDANSVVQIQQVQTTGSA